MVTRPLVLCTTMGRSVVEPLVPQGHLGGLLHRLCSSSYPCTLAERGVAGVASARRVWNATHGSPFFKLTFHVGHPMSTSTPWESAVRCQRYSSAPDVHKHTFGECWLKRQHDPINMPTYNVRGDCTLLRCVECVAQPRQLCTMGLWCDGASELRSCRLMLLGRRVRKISIRCVGGLAI